MLNQPIDFILLYLYISIKKQTVSKHSWHSINRDSFRGLLYYMKYAFPCLIICCLEWWCIECLSIIAGWLSKNELAANVALLNLNYIIYNFPLGMSYAIWAMIGNALGSNRPQLAIKYVKTSISLALAFWVLTIGLLLIFKSQFATLFTNEEHIVDIMYELIPVYALIIVCDYVQGVQGGIIRGMGYQNIASLIITISYWWFAIPIAYLLAFKFDFRLVGVWFGLPAGSILIWSSFTFILISTNWKKLAATIHNKESV